MLLSSKYYDNEVFGAFFGLVLSGNEIFKLLSFSHVSRGRSIS